MTSLNLQLFGFLESSTLSYTMYVWGYFIHQIYEIFSMGAKMDKNIFIDEPDDASKFTM